MDNTALQKENYINNIKNNVEKNTQQIQQNQTNEMTDGIEILVEMSKCGKIDPWNIDIADVTDKYLQQLSELKTQSLQMTGRTLFFAAVLLRLKSDILEGINAFEEEPFEEDFFEELDNDYDIENININNVISIDDVLERRTSTRLNRKRIVTLNDLIKQLKFYEEIDKKLALKKQNERTTKKIKSYEKLTAEDIINLAHDEYIETSVEKLQIILAEIFQTNEKVELSELNQAGMDKISTYIALLFLASRSNIELVQDEFYSDLYIVPEVKECH